jgi:hypothetical protein
VGRGWSRAREQIGVGELTGPCRRERGQDRTGEKGFENWMAALDNDERPIATVCLMIAATITLELVLRAHSLLCGMTIGATYRGRCRESVSDWRQTGFGSTRAQLG